MDASSRDFLQVFLIRAPAFGLPDALVREGRQRAVEDEAEHGDCRNGAGNHEGPTFVLAAQEDPRNDEERGEAQEGDRESQVARPHEHPFVVEHAKRMQLLVHGGLEVAEPGGHAAAGLRQGNGVLLVPLVSECQVDDCRFLGRQGLVRLPPMQGEVPTPLAWLFGNRDHSAVGEREERGHGMLQRDTAVRRDGTGHAGPQRVWRRLDGPGGAAGAVRAVVSLPERKQEQQADREHHACRCHPSGGEGTRRELMLLPCRRGGDDCAFVELQARAEPSVLADVTREDLHALAAWLERHRGDALRDDRRPDERRRSKLEHDLAPVDAVVVFARERDPLEHVAPGLTLHDSAHDVGEHERMG